MKEDLESHRNATLNSKSSFPVKLHKILSNPEFCGIVSWLSHGRSWRIINREEFEQYVIPRYFRHSNLSSFMRQVNGWGFHRISQGSDRNSYYHEKFLRGKSCICRQMQRLSPESIRRIKLRLAEESEPDFYEMSKNDPLPEEKLESPNETYIDRRNMCPVNQNIINMYENPSQYDPYSLILNSSARCLGDFQINRSLNVKHPCVGLSGAQSLLDHTNWVTSVQNVLQQATDAQIQDNVTDLVRHLQYNNTQSHSTAMQMQLMYLKINELEKYCDFLEWQRLI